MPDSTMLPSALLLVISIQLFRTAATGESKESLRPVFLEPIQNVTFPAGRNVRLACVVDHLGSYKVAWIEKEHSIILTVGNHVITRNPRVSVTHDSHRTWFLGIRDVEPRDEGTYMCQINTEPVISQTGFLTVNVPPLIKDDMTSRDMKLLEGTDVTLACSARGSPVPKIKWVREDKHKIRVNGSIMVDEAHGPLLTLHNLKRTDMAAYLCIASNGVPPSISKRITVDVEFQPLVYAPLQLVHAYFGQQMSMECFIEAFPVGLSYWNRPGGYDILHSDAKYNITTAVNNESGQTYKIRTVLTIKDIDDDDTGEYRCISKNSQGGSEQAVKLSASRMITNSAKKNTINRENEIKHKAVPKLKPKKPLHQTIPTEVLPVDKKAHHPNSGQENQLVDTKQMSHNLFGHYPTLPDLISACDCTLGNLALAQGAVLCPLLSTLFTVYYL